ncbi:MAG: metallophosphoesterase [Candidatus Eremiobacteraeota bacterium]|nr:metallophosphoesterase [Candidatus Eremiobacteraeota bacterium]
MKLTLLCVGDMHLGRRPLIAGSLRELMGHATGRLRPLHAWNEVVKRAVSEHVDAVLLLGDVVDKEHGIFEAYGPLEKGVRSLEEAGISVFAVAGNHDMKALPRLAAEIPHFHLLGSKGTWEHFDLLKEGVPLARLVGWSFPQEEVKENPFGHFTITDHLPGSPMAVIGLLHCDRDKPSSRYAPVSTRDFDDIRISAWFLGHIHKPDDLSGKRPCGYAGSLMGMDPTERGPHGPWLVTVENREVTCRHLPLSPLRWEEVVIPIDGIRESGDLLSPIVQGIESRLDELKDELGEKSAVGCRVRLSGRTSLHGILAGEVKKLAIETLCRHHDRVAYFIDKVSWDETRPELPLEEYARENDPPGILAKLILALERNDSSAKELIREAKKELEREKFRSSWNLLDASDPDDEQVRSLLLLAGLDALDALAAQHQAH